MIEARQSFQQMPISSPLQETKEWQHQIFKPDDDLVLPISIYLASSKGREEIIEGVVQAVSAYGFTKIVRTEQASGSFFFRMEVGYESKDRHLARSQKIRLNKALIEDDDSTDSTPEEHRAVKKVKQSLRARLKKGLSAITIGSVLLFAGKIAGNAAEGAVEDVLKDAIKPAITKSIQKMDTFVAKELPPAQAQRFHKAVKNLIDNSKDKTTVNPPPSSKP